MTEKLPPIHPGEVLREEFLLPLGISAYRLAKRLGVTQSAISALLREERGVSAAMALRLARCLRTTPQFWQNLQARYERERAEDALVAELARIEPLAEAPT